MSEKLVFSHAMVKSMVDGLDHRIEKDFPKANGAVAVYPIPRGGIPVVYLLAGHRMLNIVSDPELADIFVDDILDSGATFERYSQQYPTKPFYVGIDKRFSPHASYTDGKWIVFPWEVSDKGDESATDNVVRMLQFIGEDATRGGLLETPKRVVKAWGEWFSGYNVDIKELLKVFTDGAEKCDEMVIVQNIPIYSHCEHHIAPIFGTATIAYIPNGSIVGLSKLSRLADAFARRLQVQERLTNQIADALEEHLSPKGVGVVIRARHMCMESRGVNQHGTHTVTSALRGVMKDCPSARAEFMMLAQSDKHG